MDTVDKLTLELFTNKTQYKKYLSKNDPENFRFLKEKREKFAKYKQEILEKTEKLLLFPDLAVSSLVQETFENYVDVLIKDFENKALEIKNIENSDSDEDVLFKNIDSTDTNISSELDSEKKTFWYSNSDSSYGMKTEEVFDHYPTNTSIRKRFIGRRNNNFL